MPKRLNLSPFRPLDLVANLQEMQKEKKQVELLHEHAVKKKKKNSDVGKLYSSNRLG